MSITNDPRDKAFLLESLPINPVPFLNRLIDIIKEQGTDACKSDLYKAVLMVILMQSYSPVHTIYLPEEFNRLYENAKS